MTILLAAFVAGVATPTASAQTGEADLVGESAVLSPNTPILPEIGTATLTLKYKYTIPTSIHNLAGAKQSTVGVTLTFNCDPGVIITGTTSRSINVDPVSAGATESEFPAEAVFGVTVDRTAPGLKTLACRVLGSATALDAQFAQSVDQKEIGSFNVKADYFPLISSNVAGKVKDSGPRKNVGFDITLSNFGNAKTQVSFEVLSKPAGKRWQVLTPDPIILDTPNGGTEATSGTAKLSIATTYKNGWNNEQGAVQLKMTARAAEQLSNPNVLELQSNMLVRIRGVYVPGFEPVVMLGAVLGAGLMARMLRNEEE